MRLTNHVNITAITNAAPIVVIGVEVSMMRDKAFVMVAGYGFQSAAYQPYVAEQYPVVTWRADESPAHCKGGTMQELVRVRQVP